MSRVKDDSRIVEELRRAQVLCIDEGHNFLSNKANRTQRLLRNIADHVVLFTATPINRGVQDLLNIADLLGADNLQQTTVERFKEILGFRSTQHTLVEEELALIRAEIQRFTVRRTKADLNRLIAENPDSYRSRDGRPCRFPKHSPHFYVLNETDRDTELAEEIKALTGQLRAVAHFRKPLELSRRLRDLGWSEEAYLEHRLKSAVRLSRYMVLATLRSSRAALVEHILGTTEVHRHFDIGKFEKTPSGAMIKRLYSMRDKLPKSELSIQLPDWLSDEAAHQEACQADIDIYSRIKGLALEISSHRDDAKVARLLDLYSKNDFVLAFDSRPISLAVFRAALAESSDARILLATGNESSQRREFMEAFAPESSLKAAIGLCSDSMAEGVNLQKASTVVHLDMPSVVRVAEQRVGRVDRMDSVHDEVEAWWPDDGPAFRVSSDDRFIERYQTVDSLLGSNMPLPGRQPEQLSTVAQTAARDLVQEYESVDAPKWDHIADAFQPVRSLVQGDTALIGPAVYRRNKRSTHRVMCRVSLVKARQPWAFFCLAAGEFAVPRWLLVPGLEAPIITDLEEVVAALRTNLQPGIDSLTFDGTATSLIDQFLKRLHVDERELLPKKKKRELEEMEDIVAVLISSLADSKRFDEQEALLRLQEIFKPGQDETWPDYDEISSRWLDIIRPTWFRKLQQPRNRPLLLRDIRADLLAEEDHLVAQVIENFETIPKRRRRMSVYDLVFWGLGSRRPASPPRSTNQHTQDRRADSPGHIPSARSAASPLTGAPGPQASPCAASCQGAPRCQ